VGVIAPGVVEEVSAFVAAERLLGPGEPVLAMVSGGADSTLLVHVLCALGHPVEALHVEHRLRGAESEGDAGFCRALADRLSIPLRSVAGAVKDGPNLEARARAVRRRAALDAAAGRSIATGHTRDDRVETILYRLAASRGRSAFRTLCPREGAWIRPLLGLGRDRVRAVLREAAIEWREDATNADRRFARNRIRLDLLPALRTLHPAAELNLLGTAGDLADEADALDAAARTLLVDGALDVQRAAAAEPALARAALRLLTGRPAPPRVGLDRALALCRSTSGTATAPLGGGLVAERSRDRLVVRRP
jgi:tRNA(Ile)-lysidine synthase